MPIRPLPLLPHSPVADSAQPQRKGLAWAMLLVVTVHAAALLQWPRWLSAHAPSALALEVAPLETRTIVPPAPPPPPVAPPVTAPPKAAVAAPTPKPPPLRKAAVPKPAAAPLGARMAAAKPATRPRTTPQPGKAAPGTAPSGMDARNPSHEGADAQGNDAQGTDDKGTAADKTAQASKAAASNTAPTIPPGLLALSKAPARLPASFTLAYDARGQIHGVNNGASGSLQWRNSGNAHYSVTLDVLFLGGLAKFSFGSEGAVTPHGLRPERFTDNRRGKIRQAVFERDASGEAGTIHFSNGRADVGLLPGAQDYTSVVLQLAGLVNAAPAQFKPGRTFELQAAGPNSAAVWKVRVEPSELLPIGDASVDAIKLRQLPASDQGRTTEVWLIDAQSVGQGSLIPGRIRLSEANGDFVELVLKKLP